MDADEAEVRVLGCLVEKQRTTPDGYPLTLNALRLACNQSTNRDPVVDYDDATVRSAAERLARRRLARFASGHSSRAAKYRQLFGEEVGLADDELALLALLMLRGPQTPGELKARAERLHSFDGPGAVQETLGRLVERELVGRLRGPPGGRVERELVGRLGRRPGQKEERFAHRLSENRDDGEVVTPDVAGRSLEERVERLERELAELRRELSG